MSRLTGSPGFWNGGSSAPRLIGSKEMSLILSLMNSLRVSARTSFFVSSRASLIASFLVTTSLIGSFCTGPWQSEFAALMSPALSPLRWPIWALAGLIGTMVSLPSIENALRG